MYNIILADDEPIIVNGIQNFINWKELNCQICATFSNGLSAYEYLMQNSVDILITDIRMPEMDGLELARKIYEEQLSVKVIILSGYSDFQYAQKALRYSVFDFIVKNNPLEKLTDSVKKAVNEIEKNANQEQKYRYIEEQLVKYGTDLRRQFYHDLINNTFLTNEEKFSRANDLNVDIQNYTTIAIKFIPSDTSISRTKITLSLVHFCALAFESLNHTVILTHPWQLCILLPLSSDYSELEQIEEICLSSQKTAAQLMSMQLFIGISSSYSDIFDLKCAYDEAFSAIPLHQPNSEQIYHGLPKTLTSHPMLEQVLDFMHLHYNEDISLNQLAEIIHVNPSYLSTIFKKVYGDTIFNHLNQYRIEQAKTLLIQNNAKLYEIATLVGYSDAAYFSNLFKKHTGYTPSEYRTRFMLHPSP